MPKKFSNLKKCFVPMCNSISNRQPDKIFVPVPTNPEIRKQWFLNVNKTYTTKNTEPCHCCQDHFDFERELVEDILGSKTFNAKPNVFPHHLHCQEEYRRECIKRVAPGSARMASHSENATPATITKKLEPLPDDKMESDQNGREFKKIVYDGNKKLTLFIKCPGVDEKEKKSKVIEIDSDHSDLDLSFSTISSVSSTGLNISWSDLSLDSD